MDKLRRTSKFIVVRTFAVLHDIKMMMSRANKKYALIIACILGTLYVIFSGGFEKISKCNSAPMISRKTSVVNKDGSLYEYDRQSPIVFIGGVPRSGTT